MYPRLSCIDQDDRKNTFKYLKCTTLGVTTFFNKDDTFLNKYREKYDSFKFKLNDENKRTVNEFSTSLPTEGNPANFKNSVKYVKKHGLPENHCHKLKVAVQDYDGAMVLCELAFIIIMVIVSTVVATALFVVAFVCHILIVALIMIQSIKKAIKGAPKKMDEATLDNGSQEDNDSRDDEEGKSEKHDDLFIWSAGNAKAESNNEENESEEPEDSSNLKAEKATADSINEENESEEPEDSSNLKAEKATADSINGEGKSKEPEDSSTLKAGNAAAAA